MKQRVFPSYKNNTKALITKVHMALTWHSVNDFYGDKGYFERIVFEKTLLPNGQY